MIKIFSRDAADDVMSECFDQSLKLDRLMKAIVRRILSSLLFIQPVPRFIKPHVD